MSSRRNDSSPAESGARRTRPWLKYVHLAVFVSFAGLAWLFAWFVAPPDGNKQLVMWIAMWFGLSYIYSMLLVSFWVRKRFEGSRGKVEDHRADFNL